MLYEIKTVVTKTSDKGEPKSVREHFILDAELHGEAEKVGFNLYPNTDVDVVAVFRSDVHEILNEKEEDKPFFKAVVVDVVEDDNGNEKEMKYQLLVCATDLVAATDIVSEHIKQGYNMRLDSIRRTKIADYISYDNR